MSDMSLLPGAVPTMFKLHPTIVAFYTFLGEVFEVLLTFLSVHCWTLSQDVESQQASSTGAREMVYVFSASIGWSSAISFISGASSVDISSAP
jgi:Na+-transporting NADH:ubiquinone oxidoreductase subunit NqrE